MDVVFNEDKSIESKRLILRNWKDEDVNDLVQRLNNIEIDKWMAGVPSPYTEKDGTAGGGIWLNEQYQKKRTGLLKDEFIEWSDKSERWIRASISNKRI